MRDVPMPRDLSEEKVAVWLHAVLARDAEGLPWPQALARAVRALVSAKVREAVRATDPQGRMMQDEIVSRVLGDHPQGGHDEGRPARGEAPRG